MAGKLLNVPKIDPPASETFLAALMMNIRRPDGLLLGFQDWPLLDMCLEIGRAPGGRRRAVVGAVELVAGRRARTDRLKNQGDAG